MSCLKRLCCRRSGQGKGQCQTLAAPVLSLVASFLTVEEHCRFLRVCPEFCQVGKRVSSWASSIEFTVDRNRTEEKDGVLTWLVHPNRVQLLSRNVRHVTVREAPLSRIKSWFLYTQNHEERYSCFIQRFLAHLTVCVGSRLQSLTLRHINYPPFSGIGAFACDRFKLSSLVASRATTQACGIEASGTSCASLPLPRD